MRMSPAKQYAFRHIATLPSSLPRAATALQTFHLVAHGGLGCPCHCHNLAYAHPLPQRRQVSASKLYPFVFTHSTPVLMRRANEEWPGGLSPRATGCMACLPVRSSTIRDSERPCNDTESGVGACLT